MAWLLRGRWRCGVRASTTSRWRGVLDRVATSALATLGGGARMHTGCGRERMPVLVRALGLLPTTVLDRSVLVVASQHVLETTAIMLRAMCAEGLPRENVALLGKCYSTKRCVYEALRESGFNVSADTVAYDSHAPFDAQFEGSVRRLVERELVARIAADRHIRTVLLLDDGGYLTKTVNDWLEASGEGSAASAEGACVRIGDRRVSFVGVEQTSSGWQRLRLLDVEGRLRVPVMNVARSRAKLMHESPLIAQFTLPRVLSHIDHARELWGGEAVADGAAGGMAGHQRAQRAEAEAAVDGWAAASRIVSTPCRSRTFAAKPRGEQARGEWCPQMALVLGGGPIGANAAALLAEHEIDTLVYDNALGASVYEGSQHRAGTPSPLRAVLERLGLGAVPPVGTVIPAARLPPADRLLRCALPAADVVLGCTGGTSLPPALFDALSHRTVLASLSSSDRELSAVELRRRAPRSGEWNNATLVALPPPAADPKRDAVAAGAGPRSLYLAFSGFPLTFDDDCSHAGEPEHMQLTMGLLAYAALSALHSVRGGAALGGGFHALDNAAQDALIAEHCTQNVPELVARDFRRR